MNSSERMDLIENACKAREANCPAVNKAFFRTIIVILTAWGMLWAYFEFRVYPGVVDAQNEIRDLYKLMIHESRLSYNEEEN